MSNELISVYFLNDLNTSVLALCDTLRCKESLPFVFISLFHEYQHHRAYFLLKENPSLLSYKDVYLLYVKIIHKLKLPPLPNPPIDINKLNLPFRKSPSINTQSLNLLHESKLQTSVSETKSKLIESFKLDHRNLEALIMLYEIGYNDIEMAALINKINKPNLKNLYLQIFSPSNRKEIYSLFQARLIITSDYREKKADYLLQFGSYLLSVFPNSELGYLALGFHFILKKNYKKAKQFLYMALDLNKGNPAVFIALGTANSLAFHREYSNLSFKKALSIDPNNYKILFLLGREYFLSNYFNEALPLLKMAYDISKDKQIGYFYIMALIRSDHNEIAKSLLEKFNDSGFWAVCYILEKNYSSAIDAIAEMEKSFCKFLLMAIVTFLINCDAGEARGIFENALKMDVNCVFLKKLIGDIEGFDRKSMFAFFEDHLVCLGIVDNEFYWVFFFTYFCFFILFFVDGHV
ncbi:hypothetical protein CDIK_0285 [Cucumispora dikerogammari]|nr:hypothetical protein CDIK_0285 [Cucumispora dikerogammari]